jgi:hypothetical protein
MTSGDFFMKGKPLGEAERPQNTKIARHEETACQVYGNCLAGAQCFPLCHASCLMWRSVSLNPACAALWFFVRYLNKFRKTMRD